MASPDLKINSLIFHNASYFSLAESNKMPSSKKIRTREIFSGTQTPAPEVGDTEHELQDAISASNDRRIRYSNRPSAVFGVGNPRKYQADSYCVHEHAQERLYTNKDCWTPTVVWAGVAVTCPKPGQGPLTCSNWLPAGPLIC